jgi:anti-sigma B factor antagonist
MPSACETTVQPAPDAGGTAVVRIAGEVDGSAKTVLPAAYADAVTTRQPATVLLDFHDVDYINSTGIAVIVSVLAQARANGVHIAAAGLSEHYRHIFTITRLVDYMEVVPPTVATASDL